MHLTDSFPLALCATQNPLDPKVWSRTPFNVAEELERRGRLGPTIVGKYHLGHGMKARAALAALYYGTPRQVRGMNQGALIRNHQARHIARQIAALGVRHVLHFCGDRHLPLPPLPPGTRQYLLIDSTWADWDHPKHSRRYVSEVDRALGIGYRQMDQLFVTADFVRDTLADHYGINPERITVVGTGRGVIQPFYGEKDYADGTILFVAKERLADKGWPLLIEGFRLAQQVNPRLSLRLVGHPSFKQYESRVPNLKTYGFLPLEHLQQLFNESSLYAMPASQEPWGLVFLEALACRTPVLGLNRKAFPEIAGYGRFGFIVDPATPRAVADGLLSAFSDPDRLARMGNEGQRHVLERFTWTKVVDRILAQVDGERKATAVGSSA
jgi:glycosyltransferase involved in cell wall biosynthesis